MFRQLDSGAGRNQQINLQLIDYERNIYEHNYPAASLNLSILNNTSISLNKSYYRLQLAVLKKLAYSDPNINLKKYFLYLLSLPSCTGREYLIEFINHELIQLPTITFNLSQLRFSIEQVEMIIHLLIGYQNKKELVKDAFINGYLGIIYYFKFVLGLFMELIENGIEIKTPEERKQTLTNEFDFGLEKIIEDSHLQLTSETITSLLESINNFEIYRENGGKEDLFFKLDLSSTLIKRALTEEKEQKSALLKKSIRICDNYKNNDKFSLQIKIEYYNLYQSKKKWLKCIYNYFNNGHLNHSLLINIINYYQKGINKTKLMFYALPHCLEWLLNHLEYEQKSIYWEYLLVFLKLIIEFNSIFVKQKEYKQYKESLVLLLTNRKLWYPRVYFYKIEKEDSTQLFYKFSVLFMFFINFETMEFEKIEFMNCLKKVKSISTFNKVKVLLNDKVEFKDMLKEVPCWDLE